MGVVKSGSHFALGCGDTGIGECIKSFSRQNQSTERTTMIKSVIALATATALLVSSAAPSFANGGWHGVRAPTLNPGLADAASTSNSTNIRLTRQKP